MSLRASSGLPAACSGDMYGIVPTSTPGDVASASCECIATSVLVELGQAEICQLRVAAFGHQDIARLDIAVQDPGGVRRRQPVGDADQQVDDLPPRATSARDQSSSVPPSTNSVTRVLAALELAGLVHGENVRMVERRGGLRLLLETAARGFVGNS